MSFAPRFASIASLFGSSATVASATLDATRAGTSHAARPFAVERLEERVLFALPTGWSVADVGVDGMTVAADYADGTFTVASNARTLAPNQTSENFRFVYQERTGNFEIVGRLDTLSPTKSDSARFGLMVRETLAADSRYAFTFHRGRDGNTIVRDAPGGPSREIKYFNTTDQTSVELNGPNWFRIMRWGDHVSIYRSDHPGNWGRPASAIQLTDMSSTIHLGLAVGSTHSSATTVTGTASDVTVSELRPQHKTSWLGNTWEGANRQVPMNLRSMYVDPATGTIYTAGGPDEQGPEGVVMDTDGKWKASLYVTGKSIGVGDGRLYVDRNWTSNGVTHYGIRRFDPDGSKANFTGASDGNFLPVSTTGKVRGVAVSESADELYLSTYSDSLGDTGTIHVFDTNNLAAGAKRTFAVARPAQLALDAGGNLWVTQTGDAASAPRVLRYSATGTLQRTVNGPSGWNPRGLTFDAGNGRLLVADSGPDQNVKIYNSATLGSSTISSASSTFGDTGGVFGGATPGAWGPKKLWFPYAVGVDNAGAIYVGGGGTGFDANDLKDGSEIRKFASTSASTPTWARYGLEGMTNAHVDPAADTNAHSPLHRYSLNYANTAPGGEWGGRYQAVTLDPFRYPHDPRIGSNNEDLGGGVQVVNKGGAKFLFAYSQGWNGGQKLSAYRFDGEIAVPMSLFYGDAPDDVSKWPFNRANVAAEKTSILWQDDGDGQMEAGEYTDISAVLTYTKYNAQWFVDGNADVWFYHGGRAMERWVSTLTADGRLTYALDPVAYSRPAEVDSIYGRSVFYDAANDRMYFLASTKLRPDKTNPAYISAHNTELMRYDGWLTGSPALAWRAEMPTRELKGRFVNGHEVDVPAQVSVAGGYVFVANQPGYITAFSNETGARVSVIAPGPEVGESTGLYDTARAINAHQRSNGEYVLLAEENEWGKVMLYRDAGLPPSTPDTLVPKAVSSTRIDLTWTDRSTVEGGFKVERATDPLGLWKQVGANVAASSGGAGGTVSFSDTTVAAGQTYYYRVRAYGSTSGDAMASVPVGVTSPPTSSAFSSVKVNFQPDVKSDASGNATTVEVPTGFLADNGLFYGDRGNGYTYGWDSSQPRYYAVDEDSANAPDQQRDTLISLHTAPGRRWEMAVPNGIYRVRIVGGDPRASGTSTYKVAAEGTLVLDGTVTSTNRYLDATRDVTVTDGMLTVTAAAGDGNNSKINFIEVTQVMTQARHQAEDATLAGGAVVASNHAGAEGTFVDFPTNGGTATWSNVSAATAGSYTLKFRYANGGSSGARTAGLSVNGSSIAGGVTFASTGSWSTWTTVSITVNLLAASNSIVLSSIGQDAGNVDWLEVVPA